MPVIATPAGLVYEIILIDLVALLLAVAVVWMLWYFLIWNVGHEVRDPQFFVTFILVIVPFVMLICFGMAIIHYDAVATRSGWSTALPLKPLSPPILGAAVFYFGQTLWLWSRWRKL
jgi:glucan phosphoethanolaminetransferase (alkaline phosphatase superfamily)